MGDENNQTVCAGCTYAHTLDACPNCGYPAPAPEGQDALSLADWEGDGAEAALSVLVGAFFADAYPEIGMVTVSTRD